MEPFFLNSYIQIAFSFIETTPLKAFNFWLKNMDIFNIFAKTMDRIFYI